MTGRLIVALRSEFLYTKALALTPSEAPPGIFALLRAGAGRAGPAACCILLQLAALEVELAPGVVLFHVDLEGLLAGQLIVLQTETGQGSELAQLGRDAA